MVLATLTVVVIAVVVAAVLITRESGFDGPGAPRGRVSLRPGEELIAGIDVADGSRTVGGVFITSAVSVPAPAGAPVHYSWLSALEVVDDPQAVVHRYATQLTELGYEADPRVDCPRGSVCYTARQGGPAVGRVPRASGIRTSQ